MTAGGRHAVTPTAVRVHCGGRRYKCGMLFAKKKIVLRDACERGRDYDILSARSRIDWSVESTELIPSSPSFIEGLISLIASAEDQLLEQIIENKSLRREREMQATSEKHTQ